MFKDVSYVINDEEELNALLRFWIDALGMQGWEVYARFFSLEDMTDSEDGTVCMGETTWLFIQKQATIKIMSWDAWEAYREKVQSPFSFDQEATLLHEVLHFYFGAFEERDKEGEIEEGFHQMIEMMARTLVRLKRMKP